MDPKSSKALPYTTWKVGKECSFLVCCTVRSPELNPWNIYPRSSSTLRRYQFKWSRFTTQKKYVYPNSQLSRSFFIEARLLFIPSVITWDTFSHLIFAMNWLLSIDNDSYLFSNSSHQNMDELRRWCIPGESQKEKAGCRVRGVDKSDGRGLSYREKIEILRLCTGAEPTGRDGNKISKIECFSIFSKHKLRH